MPITFALVCLVLAVLLALYRLIRGPSLSDRVMAFDFIGVTIAVTIVVVAIRTGYVAFLDGALIVSILGFLSTVALSRYVLKGQVME